MARNDSSSAAWAWCASGDVKRHARCAESARARESPADGALACAECVCALRRSSAAGASQRVCATRRQQHTSQCFCAPPSPVQTREPRRRQAAARPRPRRGAQPGRPAPRRLHAAEGRTRQLHCTVARSACGAQVPVCVRLMRSDSRAVRSASRRGCGAAKPGSAARVRACARSCGGGRTRHAPAHSPRQRSDAMFRAQRSARLTLHALTSCRITGAVLTRRHAPRTRPSRTQRASPRRRAASPQ